MSYKAFHRYVEICGLETARERIISPFSAGDEGGMELWDRKTT